MAWSPDGREIAFLRDLSFTVVSVDGSGERVLTRNAIGSGFDWASDGTIAFTRVRGGYRDIHVMNADGSGQRRLARSPGFEGTPAWSPVQRRT
jgi:TolB protein